MDDLQSRLHMRGKLLSAFGNSASESDVDKVADDPGAAEDVGNSLFGKPAFLFQKPWKNSPSSPLVAALDQMNRLDDLIVNGRETLAAMNMRKPPDETVQVSREAQQAPTSAGVRNVSEDAEIERLLAERSRRKQVKGLL